MPQRPPRCEGSSGNSGDGRKVFPRSATVDLALPPLRRGDGGDLLLSHRFSMLNEVAFLMDKLFVIFQLLLHRARSQCQQVFVWSDQVKSPLPPFAKGGTLGLMQRFVGSCASCSPEFPEEPSQRGELTLTLPPPASRLPPPISHLPSSIFHCALPIYIFSYGSNRPVPHPYVGITPTTSYALPPPLHMKIWKIEYL